MTAKETFADVRIVGIIQARMGSTRLPGKVLKPIGGAPLIAHLIRRMKASHLLNDLVVATTDSEKDLPLVEWCEREKISFVRGSETDVLGRYFLAAKMAKADVIARITADDPLKDPALIDQVLEKLLLENLDFCTNNEPPSYPEGLDVEVFRFQALQLAAAQAQDPFEREHVTPYFRRHPELFRSAHVNNSQNESHHRWTLDTEADLEFMRRVYEDADQISRVSGYRELIQFCESHPDIMKINQNVTRSHLYRKQV